MTPEELRFLGKGPKESLTCSISRFALMNESVRPMNDRFALFHERLNQLGGMTFFHQK